MNELGQEPPGGILRFQGGTHPLPGVTHIQAWVSAWGPRGSVSNALPPEPEAPSHEGGWRYGNSERHPVEGFQEAALLRVNICPALGLALSITASGPSHSGHCTTISGTRFH